MLLFSATRQTGSIERPLAPGHFVTAEGQVLVYDLASGGVKPATGAAGELIAGFALATQINAETAPRIETVTADNAGAIEVGFTPLVGTIRLTNAATGAAVTIDGTTVVLAGKKVTGLVADTAYTMAYTFQLTVAQAKMLQGDVLPGGAAANVIGTTGVIYDGDVYTDQFDTAANWGAAVGVKLAAAGRMTAAATAAEAVPGVRIVSLPNVQSGFLGVHVNV